MVERSDKYCLDRCDLGDAYINTLLSLKDLHDIVLRDLPLNGSVLDAGAGEGKLCKLFTDKGHSYLGIDSGVGHPAWDFNNVCNIDLNEVDVALSDRYFDAILLIQVLEHLPNPVEIVGKLASRLKPSGKLYVSVPMSQSVHQVPYDFYRYTPYGLRYIGDASGLMLHSIYPQEAGDLESNVRRFIWSIDYAKKTLPPQKRLILNILKLFNKVIHKMMRSFDKESRRHIHPLGYVAIYSSGNR